MEIVPTHLVAKNTLNYYLRSGRAQLTTNTVSTTKCDIWDQNSSA